MTPEDQAPAAPIDEQTPPVEEPGSGEPQGETQDPAAAAQAEPVTTAFSEEDAKKLRDRLAEQGRRTAEANRLALQQAQEIAALKGQMAQLTQFATQQTDAAEAARLAQMDPEQQIAYLHNKLLQVQRQPAPQIQQLPQDDAIRARMLEHLETINTTLGLEETPLTPEEIGKHPDEATWLSAAWRQGATKATQGANIVPANKKPENSNAATTTPDIKTLVAQEVARVTGTGRPNSATPAGTARSGASIADLNKMAAQSGQGKSPRAIADEMRKLQLAG